MLIYLLSVSVLVCLGVGHPLGASNGGGGGGGVHSGRVHQGNRITHACENITFPHNPHAVGKDDWEQGSRFIVSKVVHNIVLEHRI